MVPKALEKMNVKNEVLCRTRGLQRPNKLYNKANNDFKVFSLQTLKGPRADENLDPTLHPCKTAFINGTLLYSGDSRLKGMNNE